MSINRRNDGLGQHARQAADRDPRYGTEVLMGAARQQKESGMQPDQASDREAERHARDVLRRRDPGQGGHESGDRHAGHRGANE
jgi:hypothetical protein